MTVVHKIMATYVTIMLEDDDKETVALACEAVSAIAKEVMSHY